MKFKRQICNVDWQGGAPKIGRDVEMSENQLFIKGAYGYF